MLWLDTIDYFWSKFKNRPRLTLEDIYFSYEFQYYALSLDDDEDDVLVAHELHLRLRERMDEERRDAARLDYGVYLQTPEWQERAESAKAGAGYRCRLCNEGGALEAHHRTYERLGEEAEDDLTPLCQRCHDGWHRLVGFPR